MHVPLEACREPAVSYNRLLELVHVFEHKTQYLLIHALYIRIGVFWHINDIPPWIP